MRRFTFGLYLVILCAAPAAWASDAAVAGDTYINSTSRVTNYGSQPSLLIGNGSSALIQFDLSQLQSLTLTNANIQKATLTLFVNTVTNPGSLTLA